MDLLHRRHRQRPLEYGIGHQVRAVGRHFRRPLAHRVAAVEKDADAGGVGPPDERAHFLFDGGGRRIEDVVGPGLVQIGLPHAMFRPVAQQIAGFVLVAPIIDGTEREAEIPPVLRYRLDGRGHLPPLIGDGFGEVGRLVVDVGGEDGLVGVGADFKPPVLVLVAPAAAGLAVPLRM